MEKYEEQFRKLWFKLGEERIYQNLLLPDYLQYFKEKTAKRMGISHPILPSQMGSCPACAFVYETTKDLGFSCKFCPIDWGLKYNKTCTCERAKALYSKWRRSKTIAEAAGFAKQIAKLPWQNKLIRGGIIRKHTIEVRKKGKSYENPGEVIKKIKRRLYSTSLGNFNPIFCTYKKKKVWVHSKSGDLSDPFRRNEFYLTNLYIEEETEGGHHAHD
jgi:hypothetical protein